MDAEVRLSPVDLTPEPTTARRTPGDAPVPGRLGFERACLPHQAELLSIGTRLCRNRDTARDLVQETLLRAMIAWEGFQSGSSPRAWLIRILTNAFISDYRRAAHHRRMVEAHPADVYRALHGRPEEGEDPIFGIPPDDLCDEVKAAVGQLGPEYRDVVERADLRGEKYRDVSRALDVPIGTVMSRLFRARRSLEGELATVAARDYGIRRLVPRRGSKRRADADGAPETAP